MEGRTTFVIAHRLSTVRRADVILVMIDGQIVQRGRHEDLLQSKGPYREIYDLQLSREQGHPAEPEFDRDFLPTNRDVISVEEKTQKDQTL